MAQAELKSMPTSVAEQTTEVKLTEKTLTYVDDAFTLQAEYDEKHLFTPVAIQIALYEDVRLQIRKSYDTYKRMIDLETRKNPRMTRDQVEVEFVKTPVGRKLQKIAARAKELSADYNVKLGWDDIRSEVSASV